MARITRPVRRRRSMAVAAAAACCVVGVAACGSNDESPSTGAATGDSGSDKPVNIAFLGYSANNAYTASAFKAAQAAAAKHGAKVTFFDSKFDGAAQLAQARDVVSSGRYQAMLILPNNSQQMASAAEEAIAKGVKVAAVDYVIGPNPSDVTKPGVEGISVQIGADMVGDAKLSAEKAVELCEGIDPCNVGIIIGGKANEFDALRYEQYKQILGAAPNVKVVSEAEDAWLPDQAQKVTRDMIQANPDINVLLTSNDQACVGAERAAEDAGKTFAATTKAGGGQIACLGSGTATQAVEALREGKWASSTVLLPATISATAVEQLVKAVRDPSTPPYIKKQSDLSPVGQIATPESVKESPDFVGEWTA
jgi:ribose transport system substrate-binding protein